MQPFSRFNRLRGKGGDQMAEEFEKLYQKIVEQKCLDEGAAGKILKKILKILSLSKEEKE